MTGLACLNGVHELASLQELGVRPESRLHWVLVLRWPFLCNQANPRHYKLG